MADIYDVDNQEEMEDKMKNPTDHQNPYANAPQEDFDLDIVYPSGVHPSIEASHKTDSDDFYARMARQNWIPEAKAKEWDGYHNNMFDSAPQGVVDFGPLNIFEEIKVEHTADPSNVLAWGKLDKQINTDRAQLESWGSSATNPSHYNEVPADLQHWDVVERMGWGYHLGCATKYIWRAGKKSSSHLTDNQKEIEDLQKSIVYIQKRIDLIKGEK